MKGIASLEQHACPVCTKVHDTGAVLLDRRLKDSLEDHTVTGWSFCPACQELADLGYIALVGVDASRSDRTPSGNFKPEGVWRTGAIARVRRAAVIRLGLLSEQELGGNLLLWCEQELIDRLAALPMEGDPSPSNETA